MSQLSWRLVEKTLCWCTETEAFLLTVSRDYIKPRQNKRNRITWTAATVWGGGGRKGPQPTSGSKFFLFHYRPHPKDKGRYCFHRCLSVNIPCQDGGTPNWNSIECTSYTADGMPLV